MVDFGINGIKKQFVPVGRLARLSIKTGTSRSPQTVKLAGDGVRHRLYVVSNEDTFGGLCLTDTIPYTGKTPIDRVEALNSDFYPKLRDYFRLTYPPAAIFYDLSVGNLAEIEKIANLLSTSPVPDIPLLVFGTEQQKAFAPKYDELDFFIHISPQALQRKFFDLQEQWVRTQESFSHLVNGTMALLFALQGRDNYTALHSQSVALLALLLGQKMGLSPLELELLKIGGLLHDLGKVAIPDSVLNKPGRLTAEEFTCIKKHPVFGVGIVDPLLGGFGTALKKVVMEMVKYHHRRFDKSDRSYPEIEQGLGALSLLTFIISMADAFDAMTTVRIYERGEMRLIEKIEDIKRNRGVQFHPTVADAMLGIIDEGISVETEVALPSENIIQ